MGINKSLNAGITLADSTRTFLEAPIEILNGESIPINSENTKLITKTFGPPYKGDPDAENNVLDERFFKEAIDKKGKIKIPEKNTFRDDDSIRLEKWLKDYENPRPVLSFPRFLTIEDLKRFFRRDRSVRKNVPHA